MEERIKGLRYMLTSLKNKDKNSLWFDYVKQYNIDNEFKEASSIMEEIDTLYNSIEVKLKELEHSIVKTVKNKNEKTIASSNNSR